ncbi:30S ribosomal protein S3 [Lactococcus lactis]|nr:30S ribosomal protein S3 [Lactococcus lactis]
MKTWQLKAKIISTLHTAKYQVMVIGKSGANVDALRAELNKLTGKQVHINIVEIKKPDLDAHLVGEGIAKQLEAAYWPFAVCKTRADATCRCALVQEGIKNSSFCRNALHSKNKSFEWC